MSTTAKKEVYTLTIYRTNNGELIRTSRGSLRYKPLKKALKKELKAIKEIKFTLNLNPKVKKVKPAKVKKVAIKVARKTSKRRKA